MNVKQHRRPATQPGRVRVGDADGRDVSLADVSFVAASLVIARWRHASRHTHLALDMMHHESSQVRWYAYVQRGLQEWIAHGGFAQDETEDGWDEGYDITLDERGMHLGKVCVE